MAAQLSATNGDLPLAACRARANSSFPVPVAPWIMTDTDEAATRRALRKRQRVLLHAGTTQVNAIVRLLDRDTLAPGDEALVEIEVSTPLVLWPGDRFVLRDVSAQRTIGGGQFLDLHAPSRQRRTADPLRKQPGQRCARNQQQSQCDQAERRHTDEEDRKDRERQVVQPELGESKPFGERADADLLEP